MKTSTASRPRIVELAETIARIDDRSNKLRKEIVSLESQLEKRETELEALTNNRVSLGREMDKLT